MMYSASVPSATPMTVPCAAAEGDAADDRRCDDRQLEAEPDPDIHLTEPGCHQRAVQAGEASGQDEGQQHATLRGDADQARALRIRPGRIYLAADRGLPEQEGEPGEEDDPNHTIVETPRKRWVAQDIQAAGTSVLENCTPEATTLSIPR